MTGHPAPAGLPLVGWLVVLGAVVGSFLNVVIHRMPRGISVVRPGSRCPSCGSRILARDNIPILSWILLRGRCRHCRARIPLRYLLVELSTAGLFGLAGGSSPDGASLLFMLLFISAMVVVTFIDLDHMVIPDIITLPGILLGVGAAFLGVGEEPVQALLGVLVGGGGLLAVGVGYRALTGREGLGGGDVKLVSMVGAFLGPVGAVLTVLLGSLVGTLFACVFMLRTRRDRSTELPFGSFLAPGAVLVLFLGARIVETYWGLFA